MPWKIFLQSMLPSLTLLLSKLINSLSFIFTISVNSAYLNKCQNCKSNQCYMLPLSENWKGFPLTAGNWRRLATVITKKPANVFLGIIINISSKTQCLSINHLILQKVHLLLKISSLITYFLKQLKICHLNQVILF